MAACTFVLPLCLPLPFSAAASAVDEDLALAPSCAAGEVPALPVSPSAVMGSLFTEEAQAPVAPSPVVGLAIYLCPAPAPHPAASPLELLAPPPPAASSFVEEGPPLAASSSDVVGSPSAEEVVAPAASSSVEVGPAIGLRTAPPRSASLRQKS